MTATTDAIQTVQSLVAEGRIEATPYFSIARTIQVDLSGETYENRETIKAAGFKWNPVGRVWRYEAKPSREDAVLMALAREYTEGKVEQIEDAARRASLTDEEREAEDAEAKRRFGDMMEKIAANARSRKARARGLA